MLRKQWRSGAAVLLGIALLAMYVVALGHIVACTLLIIYARSRWRFSVLLSPPLLGYLLEIAAWFAGIREA